MPHKALWCGPLLMTILSGSGAISSALRACHGGS